LFIKKWIGPFGGIQNMISSGIERKNSRKKLDPDYILTVLFTTNFIGVIFARSVHYQFYSWYFFTLPYLLWRTKLARAMKLIIFFAIELCWNIFPSNESSSGLLLGAHSLLLFALYLAE
jgi:alpha-1,3-mannosyltransferase